MRNGCAAMADVRVCPVCRAVVERTMRGNVGAHLAGPDVFPMSGQPYLVALRPAELPA